MLQEARGIYKARKLGVATPVLYHVDLTTSKIFMERIEGDTLKHLLHSKSLAEDGTLSFVRSASLNRGFSLQHVLHNWERRTCFGVRAAEVCIYCAELTALLKKLGEVIARMHDGGLIHGDLTTSNLMLRSSTDRTLVRTCFRLPMVELTVSGCLWWI